MILGVLKRLDEPLPGLRRKDKASSGFDFPAGIGQRLGANVLTNGPVRQLCGLHQEDALILRGTDVDARSSPRCLGYTHTTIVHTPVSYTHLDDTLPPEYCLFPGSATPGSRHGADALIWIIARPDFTKVARPAVGADRVA